MSPFASMIRNIKKTAADAASGASESIANIATGMGDVTITSAMQTAAAADQGVKDALLNYIKNTDSLEEGEYYKLINNRKKDIILTDLQNKYNRQIEIVEDAIELYLERGGTGNVSDYYKLKLDDIKEKIIDISGIEVTNKRKALYNLDYINSMEKMNDGIYTFYISMTLIYMVFFIRAKKYKSKLEIVILICIILYPFLIYYVMKYILGILDYIFSLTPVNVYRNLYDNNINLSTSRDNDIYLHYSKVRDE